MTRITVVTACYNAVHYIEASLRSVLDQDYPDLELIVIDGGSTDGTLAVIERYRDRIAHFVSERDDGQYHAIQKGFDRATGEVLCWLNADDMHFSWSLSVVGEVFAEQQEVDWITGLPSFLNRRGQLTSVYGAMASYPREYVANGWFNRDLGGFLQQESMFWRRSLWVKAGGLDLSLRYAADFELWTRFARHAELVPVGVPLAAFRKLPGEQRSSRGAAQYDAEVASASARLGQPPALWRAISARGLVARNLARLAIRRRAPAIIYDETTARWRKVTTTRPIARVNFVDLHQQFALRHVGRV